MPDTSLKWTPDLTVGIDKIDQQHQDLFRRVESLVMAVKRGVGPADVDEMVDFLEEYIIRHFHDEEQLMTDVQYPGFMPHYALHQQFLLDFVDLKDEFVRQGPTLAFTVKLQNRVLKWLRLHIEVEDKKLGAFIRLRLGGGAPPLPS